MQILGLLSLDPACGCCCCCCFCRHAARIEDNFFIVDVLCSSSQGALCEEGHRCGNVFKQQLFLYGFSIQSIVFFFGSRELSPLPTEERPQIKTSFCYFLGVSSFSLTQLHMHRGTKNFIRKKPWPVLKVSRTLKIHNDDQSVHFSFPVFKRFFENFRINFSENKKVFF